jgi:mono/diheme cytochrome c family protein
MSDGERTYRAKCTACHRVYQPAEETPAQWAKTLDKMEALKKVTLTPEERAQILQYLSGDALAGAAAPLR